MKIIKCDIPKCDAAAYHNVDMCHGFLESYGRQQYAPFDRVRSGDILKTDLCNKHFKQWCIATYTAFFKVKQ